MKPNILISNDDSITSKGIKSLVEAMQQIGNVIVVAPEAHQSGMGHAITMGTPLRLTRSKLFGEAVEAYQCSGTPADCVKLGKHYVMKDRQIDLIVSGVNHGSNSSISVIYSGTMSAAIEGAIEGVPAIGFSLCDYSPEAEFGHTYDWMVKIARSVLEKGLPKGVALNVNMPPATQEIKGIKICRQADAFYKESFEQRRDPYGRAYYWMDGFLHNEDKGSDTDEAALKDGYISIVPCQFDMTAYRAMDFVKELF
jgi:5'-nucleotidase